MATLPKQTIINTCKHNP